MTEFTPLAVAVWRRADRPLRRSSHGLPWPYRRHDRHPGRPDAAHVQRLGLAGGFLAGAIVAPALVLTLSGQTIAFDSPVPTPWIIIGGLIVGVGVYFGSGCTSGHGVCGIARLSPRSIAATATFMATAIVTVFVVRHVLGGF